MPSAQSAEAARLASCVAGDSLTSGRRFTPLRVATSARSSATARVRAAFSASSRSASASSSGRGRPGRVIFAEADTAGIGRVHASPVQPRQVSLARPFASRTITRPKLLKRQVHDRAALDLLRRRVLLAA
jgi:hypothetical protein